MKITSQTDLNSLPEKVYWEYSNWVKINGSYRATVIAVLQRWYYDWTDDLIEYAIIKI